MIKNAYIGGGWGALLLYNQINTSTAHEPLRLLSLCFPISQGARSDGPNTLKPVAAALETCQSQQDLYGQTLVG